MPLPAGGTWPPSSLDQIAPTLEEWAAWYTGDPTVLASVYARQTSPVVVNRPSQFRGGMVGAVARFFWGRPVAPGSQETAHLHIPLPADIATTSADMLYADPPEFTVPDEPALTATRDRLSEYASGDSGDDLLTVLAAGAEIGAALGGRFHRVTWDRELSDRPFITTVHPDNAVPEFRYGRLTAVTFHWVVDRNAGQVLRHLERHELDPRGMGLVFHALYEGTDRDLGRVVPLTENPATAPLANQVAADGALTEGRTPGLAVAYIRNQHPQRRWRTHPVGQHLGRSDYDGLEPLFDQLDEAWSSWMRDLRLGRARLLVQEEMLEPNGAPGTGAYFDLDREIFTGLPGVLATKDNGLPIDHVQFKIRVEEHERTTKALTEQIVRQAGYSAATFGDAHAGDGDITATEVTAREKKSLTTRDRKIRAERPALAALMRKMLTIDAAVFNTAGLVPDAGVQAVFPDSVQETQANLAQTATLLASARAASTQTLVKMVHPDWDDQAVLEEVDRIQAEQNLAPALDPSTIRIRPDGAPVDDTDPDAAPGE